MTTLIATDRKTKTTKPTGYVLWEGASLLDGAPIVAIATVNSSNVKTGNMIQTWILRADMLPTEMAKVPEFQASCCGVCPHQHALKGACYVNLGQAPQQVYKAYKAGKYPTATVANLALFKGRKVRLGAFGDPAAVPFNIWKAITDIAAGHTGYTHQLKHKNFDSRIASLCMLSVDTERQASRATGRYFRVRKSDAAPLLANEMLCPSETEGKQCKDCGLCDASTAAPSIVITVHGSTASRFAA